MSNVEAVFAATNNSELKASYDKWAANYENDLVGHAGPNEAVVELMKYVKPNARILDAGCGTGLVGQLLVEHGYTNLEGLDLSTGMLEQAALKKCYNRLHQQELGKPLNFADAIFDAVVIIGVFVMAHVRSNAFDELLRITKSNGYIIFTLRPEFYENTDFKSVMNELENQGYWKFVAVTEPFHGRFKAHPDVNLQVWIYRRMFNNPK